MGLKPVELPLFGGGLNLRDGLWCQPGQSPDALNVLATPNGGVRRRRGSKLMGNLDVPWPDMPVVMVENMADKRQYVVATYYALYVFDDNGYTGVNLPAPGWHWSSAVTYTYHWNHRKLTYVANMNHQLAAKFSRGIDGGSQWIGWPPYKGTYTPGPRGAYLAVTPWDNRIVNACFSSASGLGSNYSTVRFSKPHEPEDFDVDDFVDVAGGPIQGMCSWRNYVFVFCKNMFHIFYTSTPTPSGETTFEYRTINIGIGVRERRNQCVAAPDGVYFLSDSGVYVTQGAEPTCVSDLVNVELLRSLSPEKDMAGIFYHDSSIYVATGARNNHASANAIGVWRYEIKERRWTAHTLRMSVTCSNSRPDRKLVFGHTAKMGRLLLTDFGDDPARLTSLDERYEFPATLGASDPPGPGGVPSVKAWWRSPWFEPAGGQETSLRELKLWGTVEQGPNEVASPKILSVGVASDYREGKPKKNFVQLGNASGFEEVKASDGTDDTDYVWRGRKISPAVMRAHAARGTVFQVSLESDIPKGWEVYRAHLHVDESKRSVPAGQNVGGAN